MGFWNKLISWKNLRRTIYLLSASTVITNHIGEIIICEGISMEPTIKNGDIVLGEKISVSLTNLHRGDIVCAYSPTEHPDLLCKRLTFKEYDTLPDECRNLNGTRVPPGHCFLVGDNKDHSVDSRNFGPISMGLIQVRLVFRIWPPTRFGSISNHGIWEYEPTESASL